MKKMLFLTIVLLTVSACSTTPTQTAEDVLLTFVETLNNQEYEKAIPLFTEQSTIQNALADYSYEGSQGIQEFFSDVGQWDPVNEFSDFTVIGESVTFTWLWEDFEEKCFCNGSATMDGDKIKYLEIDNCRCTPLPSTGD